MLDGKLLRVRICRPAGERPDIAAMVALDATGQATPVLNFCCNQGCKHKGEDFQLIRMWPVETLVQLSPWSEPVRTYQYACSEFCATIFAMSFWEPPQSLEEGVKPWSH